MITTSLISLNCETGEFRRYTRTAANHAQETGRMEFDDWQVMRCDPAVDWEQVWGFIQNFRVSYTPPEEPGPRPTSPLRTQRAA